MSFEDFETPDRNLSNERPTANRSMNPKEPFYGDEETSNSPDTKNVHITENSLSYENPSELETYRSRNEAIESKLTDIEKRLEQLHHEDSDTMPVNHDELETLLAARESLQQEKVQAAANYPGDWTTLLQERMQHPATKAKFISQRADAIPDMTAGEPKPEEIGNKYSKRYASHYQSQIDEYDTRLDQIFNQTYIETGSDNEKYKLGYGNVNEPGTVYLNATSRRSGPLTPRQKNIIEAHEKGHGLRDFQSPTDSREIKSVIDTDALHELTEQRRNQAEAGQERFRPHYVLAPEEIVERMAQFKNYFGMQANERFTKQHLEYVRQHYITDTGLDNGISNLLYCITPRTEANFLKIINQYPI